MTPPLPTSLHAAALQAGATLLGDGPVHYLFSEEQLGRLVELLRGPVVPLLLPPPY
jgi:hypothetical protein